jgi:hypothetical protein
LLKSWVWQALLSLYHSEKHAHPHLSPSLSGQDGNHGSTLALRPLCFVLPQPRYSMSPSRLKPRKKGTLSSLWKQIVVGSVIQHWKFRNVEKVRFGLRTGKIISDTTRSKVLGPQKKSASGIRIHSVEQCCGFGMILTGS